MIPLNVYARAAALELALAGLRAAGRLPWSRRSQHDSWRAGYAEGARDAMNGRRRACACRSDAQQRPAA